MFAMTVFHFFRFFQENAKIVKTNVNFFQTMNVLMIEEKQ